ncbi:MAG TPA: hypothetical protein VNP95_06510 [Thermomicrobiales bacterium]|nr:hypothetical protein [Thermomicrobiales bacterium]
MTHPTRRFTPPPCSPDALALDRALDAWVRGDATALDALDPEMEATVAQLYAWADAGGVAEEPVVVEASPAVPPHAASPRTPRPLAFAGDADPSGHRLSRTLSRRTRIMTAFSGLAAALVLGMSIYGAVPLITDRHADPTPSEIAFQAQTSATPDAATPKTRDVPPDLIFQGGDALYAGGDQTVLPPVGTELTGAWGVDALNPVRPEECAVTPLPREEAVTILATPPSADKAPMNQDSTVDEATISEIQASFRQWQACRRAGNTFGAMALETDAFIRADFYDDGGAMASYQRADHAYSAEAAGDVLDVRISIDEQRKAISDLQAADAPGSEGGLDLNLWIINMDEAPNRTIWGDSLLPDGEYSASEDGTYVILTAVWTNPNVSSDEPFPRVVVAFKLVDGVWKIDQWDLIGNHVPQGS